MINMLTIGFILTTLVTAGVWSPSPSPPHHDHHHEVIVKEGHRVVVVEYDKEADGSTKVLFSPHDHVDPKDGSGEKSASPAEGMFSGPKELVCDAYGKCKHKIANAFTKTKDAVEKTTHEVTELEQHAKDAASGALGKAKKVADDVVCTVKDGVSKDFDVVDSPKRLGEDTERNVTGRIEEGVEQAKESVTKVGQKYLTEILSKVKNVLGHVVARDKVDEVVRLIHMLGFSTAYGMCVWVTFVSSYILGRYLPRTQFGMVQSRIYPVYFKAMAYCVSAALFGYLISQRKEIWSNMLEMFQGLSLVSALLMVLTNMVFLEPRATKLMYERLKIEKEEGRGTTAKAKVRVVDNYGNNREATTVLRSHANVVSERQDILKLNENLKRLNTYSSALNVSTLVILTWHMAYIGQRLQATR
ncbi:uncharacterized protein [Rutidosis leptorrhynchoides]|uniref:uncharacterized protein n=1 Tax=Rutidosis leptorrhynchoides TaxID=125765 RepID=UPI003A9964EF